MADPADLEQLAARLEQSGDYRILGRVYALAIASNGKRSEERSFWPTDHTRQRDRNSFFGLVAAVGTDIDVAANQLNVELHRAGYSAKIVRLSRLLSDLPRFSHLQATSGGPEDVRIDSHMEAGNELRQLMDNGDAVARLAMNEIRALRETFTDDPNKPAPRMAFFLGG